MKKKMMTLKDIMKLFSSWILAALFLYSASIFVAPINRGILNAGNAIMIVLSLFLMCCSLFYKKVFRFIKKIWKHKVAKIIMIVISIVVVAGISMCINLSINMSNAMNKQATNQNIVITLGCNVNLMLSARIEATRKYLTENPIAICIASGGQGPGADISEALAIKNSLLKSGIDEKRIYLEDKSVNTAENIKFSTNLITNELKLDANEIAIVTDGFHQYRAYLLLKKQGMEAFAVNAQTEAEFVPTYWVREWMGLVKDFLYSSM